MQSVSRVLRTYSRVVQEEDSVALCEIFVCELMLVFCEIKRDVDRGCFSLQGFNGRLYAIMSVASGCGIGKNASRHR
jgi:hypothetical protein